MRKSGVLAKIEAGIHRASHYGLWASGGFMLLMLLTVVIDVSARIAKVPIKGAYDSGEILMACITYTALAYTQFEKGHIRVDILLSRFPKRTIQVLDAIMLLACAVTALLIAYAMTGRVWSIVFASGPAPVSLLLSIPLWPFLALVALGSLLLGLEFTIDACRSGWRAVHGGAFVVPVTGRTE
jgi:TRAP-type C4-dicarboxylate transport system permease small subunit